MELYSVTDIGSKRKNNQDNYWGARLDVNGVEVGVLCICDGMGGLSDGALASKTVVEKIRDYLLSSIDLEGLRVHIGNVNRKLKQLGEEKGRMGTTCTILVCEAGYFRVLHIGDSRCYQLQGGARLRKITKDHTVLEKFTREGKILPLDMATKYRNTLTRCIGVSDDVYLDSYSGSYEKGDTFIVCSDGLWHDIDKNGLDVGDLKDLDTYVKHCIDEGETDNITIGVIRV